MSRQMEGEKARETLTTSCTAFRRSDCVAHLGPVNVVSYILCLCCKTHYDHDLGATSRPIPTIAADNMRTIAAQRASSAVMSHSLPRKPAGCSLRMSYINTSGPKFIYCSLLLSNFDFLYQRNVCIGYAFTR
jgi:hypothetical protein